MNIRISLSCVSGEISAIAHNKGYTMGQSAVADS